MRTLWPIVAGLIAIVGCIQQTATIRPSQAAQSDQKLAGANPEQEAKPEIVDVSYRRADDPPTGPRAVLIARHIDLMATQPGQAVLNQLWDEDESAGEPRAQTPRTRILQAKDVLKLLATLDSQGLGRHTASPEITIASGKSGECLGDSRNWKVTPKFEADGSVKLTISIYSLNQPPDSGPQANATAQLRESETLVIEGETFQSKIMEISRTPYLGDLPIIGGQFNKTRSIREPHQSLYLVTVEAVDTPDEPRTK